MLRAVRPRVVLELGVGSGALTERLATQERELWGLDQSPAMLVRARARVPQAALFRADVLGAWPHELSGRRFHAIASGEGGWGQPSKNPLRASGVMASTS